MADDAAGAAAAVDGDVMSEQTFIVENCPVQVTDTTVKQAISRLWGGGVTEYLRMRYLDGRRTQNAGPQQRGPSSGKVLFRLSDPSRLLDVMKPRCRRGHVLAPLDPGTASMECNSSNDCEAIVTSNSGGRVCMDCMFIACESCLTSCSRASLNVTIARGWTHTLKVKKARGAISHPKRQRQLFIHAFPLERRETGGLPVARLTFAATLAHLLGYPDVARDTKQWILRHDESICDTGRLTDIDSRVETKGLYVSNLVALTLAQALANPTVLNSIGGPDGAYRLAERIRYYVLDQSAGAMRPRPMCFFLEMVDDESAQKMQNALHDAKIEVHVDQDYSITMVLDVQYRTEEKVKRGSILEQNKTLTGRNKMNEAHENAVAQVKRFINALLKREPINERQRASASKGMNTTAKPFTPGGEGKPEMNRMSQVAQLWAVNEKLAAHPAVVAQRGGAAKVEEYLQKREEVMLARLEAELAAQEAQLREVQQRVVDTLVAREVEVTGRTAQLAALEDVAQSLTALLDDAQAAARPPPASRPPAAYVDIPFWGNPSGVAAAGPTASASHPAPPSGPGGW